MKTAHSRCLAAAIAVAAAALASCGAQPPSPGPSPRSGTSSGTSPGGELATWPLARLAAEVLVVPAQAADVAAVASEVAAGAGGVLLFGSAAPTDLAAQLSSLRSKAPPGAPPLFMTDEEGGPVGRLTNLLGSIPSAREMAATLSSAQIEQLGFVTGQRMVAVGVTMDLAPVLDADGGAGPNTLDPDGTRSFSGDEAVAAADGIAFAKGLLRAGVTPVVKHFPGLGGATGNTDYGPAATLPWPTLQGSGLLPFSQAISVGMPAVMVGNAVVPGLTSLPGSISTSVIQGVLRDRLGFTGLVVTDSLSAGALSAIGYSVPEAAVAALRAGADLLLFNAPPAEVGSTAAATVAAIVAAVQTGALSRATLEAAVQRVLLAKGAG